MKIASIVSGKRVATISPSASIYDLVSLLETHHIGALVVSPDGKKIEGIVSERDVVRAMPAKMNELSSLHVRDLMTVGVLTCTVEQTVSEILTLMTENRVRHIPVVDSSGELQSIVSIGDLVKSHISELDSERTALRDYITH